MGDYSKKLRTRVDILGARKQGYCVICGEYGMLSADHVPPKGCIKIDGKIRDSILQSLLPGKEEKTRTHIVQGGVKFNTICNMCNNTLLGTEYDPALNEFFAEIVEQINRRKGSILLSPTFSVSINSNRVARSLIGHILAAHAVPETQKKRESLGAGDSLRAYLLDPNVSFPTDWRLYCWLYPSKRQVILRHTCLANFSMPQPNSIYGHMIKFFPIAFWFVHDQPKHFQIFAPEITPERNSTLEDVDTIRFDLRNVPNTQFPENPVGNEVLLFADAQASMATPR